jgi:hypothetical protein
VVEEAPTPAAAEPEEAVPEEPSTVETAEATESPDDFEVTGEAGPKPEQQ